MRNYVMSAIFPAVTNLKTEYIIKFDDTIDLEKFEAKLNLFPQSEFYVNPVVYLKGYDAITEVGQKHEYNKVLYVDIIDFRRVFFTNKTEIYRGFKDGYLPVTF